MLSLAIKIKYQNQYITDGRKYPFYWLRFASPVKLHLRLSNPQLTPPTLQIQYYYSLNRLI
jgi:hypothetical protein